MKLPHVVFCACLGFAMTGCATNGTNTKSSWNPVDASAEELVEVEKIEATGREIYRLDQLAWHASDALVEEIQGKEFPVSLGWVVTNTQGGPLVTFINEEAGDLKVVADVNMSEPGWPIVRLRPNRPLRPTETTMFRARQTALQNAPNLCNGKQNTVVMPADDGTWDVYVLAASSDSNIVPMGGHVRVSVSSEGLSVLRIEPYSKTCMHMSKADPNLSALMATHIVSELPAPTHVFLSLTFSVPIMIGTKTHLWKIEGGKIEALVRGRSRVAPPPHLASNATPAAEAKSQGL